MKSIVSAFVLLMPLLSFAQKTKTVNVAPMGFLTITAEISYAADEKTPKDTTYKMVGIDNQFNYSQTIDQYKRMSIAEGSLQKMYNIMQSARNMFNEEIGVNKTNYGVKMSVRRPTLIKEVQFHSSDASDNGYTVLTLANVEDTITRIESYGRHHKVALKEWK